MAEENIPWMIQGGKHSAASGRRVLNKATGGAEGIAAIGDLRVRQAPVANGTVIVAPGGATMLSRYAGVKGESYDGQNNTDTTVAITANGGGTTRYDLVIARIDDWNFPGQQAKPVTLPTDTVKAFKIAVVTNVAASITKASQLNLGYPAIALARIALPAATSAVTQAMIFDLREQAVPRRQRSLTIKAMPATPTTTLNKTQAQGDMTFPTQAVWTVQVPEWATRARLRLDTNGIAAPAGGGVAGYLWARIGVGRGDSFITETTQYDTTSSTSWHRINTTVAADVAVPAAMRGQSIQIDSRGRVVSGTGYLVSDFASNAILDIEWLEAPTEDL